MKKPILLVLLGLNGLMEVVGGSAMIALPAKAAHDVFGMDATAETQRLMSIIGAATLSFAVLSGVCLLWTARGRRAGLELSVVFGLLLTLVGVVMLATGTSTGALDVAKGVVISGVAVWALSGAPELARA
jgi:hypothetical protein